MHSQAEPDPLKQHADAPRPPGTVPVFGCIVYVAPAEEGGVRARVANLGGFECTASSERAALAELVAAIKRHVGELHQRGEPIPWIDPPPPAEADESTRYVPVHL